MSSKLQIRVAKTPNPKAALSTKEVRPGRRLLRQIFGTSKPRHKMAILLPGSETTEVEVCMIDADSDLMAVADSVGVTRKVGGGR